MKRSLLTVCCLVLAAGLAACAVDADGTDGTALGESRQDLTLGDSAQAPSPQADDASGGDRPQPEPWRTTNAAPPGPAPAPDSDPRRVTSDTSVKAGGDRPQPEPWYGTGTKQLSLTTNQ